MALLAVEPNRAVARSRVVPGLDELRLVVLVPRSNVPMPAIQTRSDRFTVADAEVRGFPVMRDTEVRWGVFVGEDLDLQTFEAVYAGFLDPSSP